ncbi:MAG: hypothetical protein ACL7BU_06005 [Candidatus Phlomobacter fragariae]
MDNERKILSAQADTIRNITGRIGYGKRQGASRPPVVADEAFRQDRTFNTNVKSGENDN